MQHDLVQMKREFIALYTPHQCNVDISWMSQIRVVITSQCALPCQNMLLLGKVAQIFGTLDFRNDNNTEKETWQLSEVTSDSSIEYEHTYSVKVDKINSGLPDALTSLIEVLDRNDRHR